MDWMLSRSIEVLWFRGTQGRHCIARFSISDYVHLYCSRYDMSMPPKPTADRPSQHPKPHNKSPNESIRTRLIECGRLLTTWLGLLFDLIGGRSIEPPLL